METLSKIFSWLKSQPTWVRIVATIVVAAISAIMLFTSCGSMNKVTVRNLDPTTTVTISVSQTTSTDTDNTVNPNLNLNIKSNETQE